MQDIRLESKLTIHLQIKLIDISLNSNLNLFLKDKLKPPYRVQKKVENTIRLLVPLITFYGQRLPQHSPDDDDISVATVFEI